MKTLFHCLVPSALALLAGTGQAQSAGGPASAGSLSSPGSSAMTSLASLDACHVQRGKGHVLSAHLRGADPFGFTLFLQLGHKGVFDPLRAIPLVYAPTNFNGEGQVNLRIPDPAIFPTNFEVEFYAVYGLNGGQGQVSEPSYFLLNPKPAETLDFDWAVDGSPLPAGTHIAEQWADAGIHISATNAIPGHPDQAILFDSANPTGGDSDLATPGYGVCNDEAYGNLLILAENLVDGDGDGLVDDPDDERHGGSIVFTFDRPVVLIDMALVDVERSDKTVIRCYDGNQKHMDLDPRHGRQQHRAHGLRVRRVTRIEMDMGGSGGIGSLRFMPCPDEVDFDLTFTGIPLEMVAGEKLGQQFRSDLGFEISALSHGRRPTDQAILLDSANTTGGDGDLVTPGYHPTNTEAHDLVMIIAEDVEDADGDGVVDDPDDEARGGVISMEFEYDVLFRSATVLDIDKCENSYFEAFDADGLVVGVVPLAPLGDNSVQTVQPNLHGVRRIDLVLDGSGALVDFRFCRDRGNAAP